MSGLLRFDPFDIFEWSFLPARNYFVGWDWGPFERLTVGPETRIYKEEKDIVLELFLPGMRQSDIEVKIEKGCLIIVGKSEEDTKQKGFRTYSFTKSYALPKNFDAEKEDSIKAKLENSILRITLKNTDKEIEKNIRKVLIE